MTNTDLDSLTYSDATRQLVSYWQGLPRRDGSAAPNMADVDFATLAGITDELFLSEWYSDDVLTVIRSGAALQRWLGIDLAGHNILALFREPTASAERQHYMAVRDTPCAGMITRMGKDVAGTDVLYRTLQLPLLGPAGDVRFLIGTGASLDPARQDHQFASTYFTSVEDVGRQLFDIGSGLPDTV